ncbi:unnamed protein product [Bursaphelenchus okinawaensis]|uniref:Uncharacterized protein n=1 Tax=Bursaphelenchus okinawaensis TaxID=465554 RepID=A0A811KR07_9BILA|nr:unnamed protein product [Bursaphelenchus okinawaensis]CAG9107863.1 unnamed protein product [Bursaphelenchus okinawaensis]
MKKTLKKKSGLSSSSNEYYHLGDRALVKFRIIPLNSVIQNELEDAIRGIKKTEFMWQNSSWTIDGNMHSFEIECSYITELTNPLSCLELVKEKCGHLFVSITQISCGVHNE